MTSFYFTHKWALGGVRQIEVQRGSQGSLIHTQSVSHTINYIALAIHYYNYNLQFLIGF